MHSAKRREMRTLSNSLKIFSICALEAAMIVAHGGGPPLLFETMSAMMMMMMIAADYGPAAQRATLGAMLSC